MDSLEILKTSIKKAKENGFTSKLWEEISSFQWIDKDEKIHNTCSIHNGVVWNDAPCDEQNLEISIRDIIFSHEFAKAFWGEELVCPYCYKRYCCEICCTDECYISNYQYHLQQMVLETEPLKYLEKFL